MPDILHELIKSTMEFYARFNLEPQVETMRPVFEEEVHELIEATLQGENHTHIAEEAADVMVTAIGMCLSAGVTPEQILEQTRAVIAKNNAKTHDTHAINADGKIARKK